MPRENVCWAGNFHPENRPKRKSSEMEPRPPKKRRRKKLPRKKRLPRRLPQKRTNRFEGPMRSPRLSPANLGIGSTAASFLNDGAGLWPFTIFFESFPWGVAPGWYSGGPLALQKIYSVPPARAKGPTHSSLGRRPRIQRPPHQRGQRPDQFQPTTQDPRLQTG